MNLSKHFPICLLLACMCCSVFARGEKRQLREKKAFESAARALTDYRKREILGDAELSWSAGLKTLALSKSNQADFLLSKLGLFNVDGAFGEEYSCAASKRSKKFTIQLRRQLRNFYTDNECLKRAAREGINKEKLCATKDEFSRRLFQYRELPLKDVEGACSY